MLYYASTTVMKTKKLINYFIFTINDITYLLCFYRQIKLRILYWGTLELLPNQNRYTRHR